MNTVGQGLNVTYMECTRRLYVGEDQVLSGSFAIATMLTNLVHQSTTSYILRYGRDTEGGEGERENGVIAE